MLAFMSLRRRSQSKRCQSLEDMSWQIRHQPSLSAPRYATICSWGPPHSRVQEMGTQSDAALPGAASTADPTFEESPLQQFFLGAFEGSLDPGCSATVVNPSDRS
jgi:hypothetical protein